MGVSVVAINLFAHATQREHIKQLRDSLMLLNTVKYSCFGIVNIPKNLRAIVSNFQESGDRSKNLNFFLFAPKDPLGVLFSKNNIKKFQQIFILEKIGKVNTYNGSLVGRNGAFFENLLECFC